MRKGVCCGDACEIIIHVIEGLPDPGWTLEGLSGTLCPELEHPVTASMVQLINSLHDQTHQRLRDASRTEENATRQLEVFIMISIDESEPSNIQTRSNHSSHSGSRP